MDATPEEGEWPKRDAVPAAEWDCVMVNSNPGFVGFPFATGIPVTPEMVAAGRKELDECEEAAYAEPACIYLAMAALAPVPLVTDGELAALRERDEAVRKADSLKHQVEKWKGDFLSARDVLNENERQLAARDARIAELDTLLAARPQPEPAKPSPNPFRDFATDRRRIGP